MTFGSIDDASAPIQASSVPAPSIKSEIVKSFGSVPANAPATNGTPVRSVPKVDVKKLFQGTSSGPSPPPTNGESSVGSPSTRPSSLPQSVPPSSMAPPPSGSQLGSHSYTPFVPGLRPQQNGSNVNAGGVPRSPVYSRAMPNGGGMNANGRPGGQPGTPGPTPAAMPSPRMGPPHGVPPAGMPQHAPQAVPMQAWPGYYVRTLTHGLYLCVLFTVI